MNLLPFTTTPTEFPARRDTPILPGLSPVDNLPIHAKFDGGAMSSNGGAQTFCARLGAVRRLSALLASCIADARDPSRVVHSYETMIQSRMVAIAPELTTEPADGIERVEVSSLSFRSTDGAFLMVEKRGEDETLYQFLQRRFGGASPLQASGWQIVAATLRIFKAPRDGKKGHVLTVTLRTPNTTSVPNKTEAERAFVFGLLERWELLDPPPTKAESVWVLLPGPRLCDA